MEKVEKFQLILSCTIISLGILISSLVFASKIQQNENITVTGSASKIIKSDSAKLGFSIQARAINQKEAFNAIKKQIPIVIEYLNSKGIAKEDMELQTLSGYNNYRRDLKGYMTDDIASYTANQTFNIKSKDVEKIKEISNDIQTLVNKGINIESVYSPEYFYSDLASIKVDLLKEATLDAKQRAESMLNAAGAKVGKVKSMRMGVFQITAPDSTMVSDMGINDTSSIDKKVTAVANVVFNVK